MKFQTTTELLHESRQALKQAERVQHTEDYFKHSDRYSGAYTATVQALESGAFQDEAYKELREALSNLKYSDIVAKDKAIESINKNTGGVKNES
jgi:uncharacterized membrane protein YkoI